MFSINTKPSLYRDFALLSALIIFMLFLVSIWVSYKTYQEHSADVLKQLENEAVRIDRALIIEIERAAYLLESVARQIGTDDAGDIRAIQQLFNSFDKSSYPRNSEFYWIDADQRIVLSTRDGRLKKPIDVSDRDYMKRAITTPWAIHIGQPIEGRMSEKWVMPVAIGVSDAGNRFKGAVLISLDINSFSREIHNVIQQDGISFAITNSAFTLLTEISEKPHFFDKHFDLQRLAGIDFGSQTRGVYSRASFWDRDHIFAYYEKSSQYPYIIFVGYDANASRALVNDVLIPRLVQILVITVFLVSILWTVRKRIIQPVIALTDRTAQIVRGKPFAATSDEGPLEIEMLAGEIARIYDYIEERKRIERELSGKNAELLKIREAAEMTNQIKAQFFEQVGNALMHPAAAIREYAESFHNELFGLLSNQKYSEIAEKLNWQASILLDLIQDILTISRAEAGLLALQESEIELPLVIKKCIRLLQERSRFQSVEVVQDYQNDLPQLFADELRLKQLLLNLLSGAAAQLKAGDIIRIHSSHGRDGLTIRLDYAVPEPRLEDDTSPRAIESSPSFHIPQAGLARAEPSVGLGFALSQLIVAMHGGSLNVKTGADRKVQVTVLFPVTRVVGKA